MLQELWAIFPLLRQSTTFSKVSSAIFKWNNLDPSLRNSKSVSVFKEKILSFIQPSPNVFFLIVPILKELNLLQDLDSA